MDICLCIGKDCEKRNMCLRGQDYTGVHTYSDLSKVCNKENNYVNFIEVEKEKKPKLWMKLSGLFTPGGDPCYICPVCKDKNSEHINGIESPCHWDYCPVCRERLRYW